MATETLAPPAPALTPIAAPAPPRLVQPPDEGWVPVAFPAGAWKRWLKRRQRRKADRPDEVWAGVYMVMPIANNNHQELGWKLCSALDQSMQPMPGVRIFPGCNVSDDLEDWTKNYRCPDVAVYLPGNPAEDRETHWLGGPDFAIEVVSKNDRSRDKLGFYAKVGVREILYVERKPSWSLELFRRAGDGWVSVGMTVPNSPRSLESVVLPLSFRLTEAQPHPRIEIARQGTDSRWFA